MKCLGFVISYTQLQNLSFFEFRQVKCNQARVHYKIDGTKRTFCFQKRKHSESFNTRYIEPWKCFIFYHFILIFIIISKPSLWLVVSNHHQHGIHGGIDYQFTYRNLASITSNRSIKFVSFLLSWKDSIYTISVCMYVITHYK